MPLFVVSFVACGSGIDLVEASLLDGMETVVQVSWTTDDDVASHVDFGPGSELLWSTPDSVGTEHSALLLGLPGATEASYQVVAGDRSGDVQSIKTGSLASYFAPIAAEGDDLGPFMVGSMMKPGSIYGPVILDATGNIVWQHLDTRGLYVTRTRILKDGSGVVYNSTDLNGLENETQRLIWVDWAGNEVRVEDVDLLNHDFVELDDGTIVTLTFVERDGLKGNTLSAIGTDGSRTDLWTTWDCFDPEVDTHDEMDMGWSFSNALDYDEERGLYLLGFRNFGSIVAVDAETFECPWVFGGIASTIEVTGDAAEHQHQFELLDDGMLVFDNDGGPAVSRVIEYSLDLDAGTAEEIWSFEHDTRDVVLGDVHRLDGGDTLVVWGMDAQVQRIDPSGEVVTDFSTDPGWVMGFASFRDSLYEE